MLNYLKFPSENKPSFQPCKLYIKILVKTKLLDVLENELKNYFSAFGRIDDLKILKNKDSKFYGFVSFKEETTLIEALCRRHFIKNEEVC